MAGRAGRQGAVPGQRELHVLRQGPRRPAPARDAAARARRRRGGRAGPGVLPPARRDPPRSRHHDRRNPRCRRLLRPVVPARLQRRAPPDAPFRRPRELPRAARADPGAGPAGRSPLQLHRGLPRRDRSGVRRAGCVRARAPALRGHVHGLDPARRDRVRPGRGAGAQPDRPPTDRPGRCPADGRHARGPSAGLEDSRAVEVVALEAARRWRELPGATWPAAESMRPPS
mgnify:CR=1 FL=1